MFFTKYIVHLHKIQPVGGPILSTSLWSFFLLFLLVQFIRISSNVLLLALIKERVVAGQYCLQHH